MKQIKPTKKDIDKALKAFKEYVCKSKSNQGNINFSYNFNQAKSNRKPEVIFTEEAYAKITTLVDNYAKEIAWHGLITKDNDVYTVTDILVYPQICTSTTVEADEVAYVRWVMEQSDEVFNAVRLQGHSHVNMGVTPSATDLNYYNNVLQSLNEDDFYIFMIINKKKEINIWIYDFKDNIIFEKQDIKITLPFNNWYYQTIKDNVKDNTPVLSRKYFPYDNIDDWSDIYESK